MNRDSTTRELLQVQATRGQIIGRMMQRWVAYHIQPSGASSVNRAELPIGFVSGCLAQGLYRHANHLR
jgi:hypothetical protein